MGLANFLFSFSLLEVLDHRSGIGAYTKKLSYANMVLACLRHPCILSLGVLAPNIAFADSVVVPWLGPAGIRLPSGTKRTAMCLAALSCAQVAVRLTENLLILFRYGKRDTPSLRLADFFEFVLDGVFLAWMALNLYTATRQISRDYGGRLAWWRSHKLVYFWVLYSVFVVISAVQSLVGILHYVINTAMLSEHFVYTFFKINGINDLLLLSGIAILLRPTRNYDHFDGDGATDGMQLQEDFGEIVDNTTTTDYALLLPNGSDEHSGYNDPTVSFEMTAHATMAADAEPLMQES
ncbi:hypothetical protein IV203_006215 [Nitzschia inconspicua]|uniref:Uncharacterized protein n=1 Tax=Nitzschia inconspicua TaxID=303405 RepID=A0A9K3KPL5_9STRA|nr:hypothetical protein IV203_006215 [Nitzschia inconspicua]